MDDLADLIIMSRRAGERFDLVQAGGGNTSRLLDDGRLFVKASGMPLSAVSSGDDFCCLDWRPLISFLDSVETVSTKQKLDDAANTAVSAAANPQGNNSPSAKNKRPSIETLLHCALGPYTLHTHPVAVTSLACADNWKEKLSPFCASAFFIEYETPGPALALALRRQLKRSGWERGDASVIFLQNHGLIVAASSGKEALETTDLIVNAIAASTGSDLSRYKMVNDFSAIINQVCGNHWVCYLSEDIRLTEAASSPERFLVKPLTPDQLVYCGPACLILDGKNEHHAAQAIKQYLVEHGQPPRVLIIKDGQNNFVLTAGPSLQKCRDAEDVLKSLMVMLSATSTNKMQPLSEEEINYLKNWEAEKYRQSL